MSCPVRGDGLWACKHWRGGGRYTPVCGVVIYSAVAVLCLKQGIVGQLSQFFFNSGMIIGINRIVSALESISKTS